MNDKGTLKFCEWSKLPDYTKDGKLTFEVTIRVDEEGIEGGEPKPDFSRFLTEQPGITNRVLLVSDTRIYVSKDVGSFFFDDLKYIFFSCCPFSRRISTTSLMAHSRSATRKKSQSRVSIRSNSCCFSNRSTHLETQFQVVFIYLFILPFILFRL